MLLYMTGMVSASSASNTLPGMSVVIKRDGDNGMNVDVAHLFDVSSRVSRIHAVSGRVVWLGFSMGHAWTARHMR
jgi:hypothetical protein